MFKDMEELKAAVRAQAKQIFDRYMAVAEDYFPSYKMRGMQWVRFAREEPNLFRLLFLRRRDTAEFPPTENHSADIRRAIRETFSLTDAQADELHRHLWIYVHGLCTLIVTGVNDIPDTEAASVDFPGFLHYGGADFLQRAEIGEHRARGGAENARKLLRGDGFEGGAPGNVHGGVDDLLTGKFGFRRHGRSFFLCVIIVTQRILRNNYNAITRRRQ